MSREQATITALQLALQQSADLLATVAACGGCELAITIAAEAEITRYRAMAAPGWEALPVELNGPSVLS